MQFFVTHKYYKRLALNLKPDLPDMNNSFTPSTFKNKLVKQSMQRNTTEGESPVFGNNSLVK